MCVIFLFGDIMNFIGTKFNTPKNGVLTVVGKLPREPGKDVKYQLECSICSTDKELFPELFTTTKSTLTRGQCPCGCSPKARKTKEQYQNLITRRIAGKYQFLGFVGPWKSIYTKIKLRCLVDGHQWEPTYNSMVNQLMGCPCCAGNVPYTTETAETKIQAIIKGRYQFLGFVGTYTGVSTRVKLRCLIDGHTWEPTFTTIVHSGSGCPCCAKHVPCNKQ